MSLCPKAKILFLALMICVAFSIVSAETLMAIDFLHHCPSASCRPCLRIEIAKAFLKTLSLAGIGAAIFALSMLAIQEGRAYIKLTPCPLSPVILKDRLNS